MERRGHADGAPARAGRRQVASTAGSGGAAERPGPRKWRQGERGGRSGSRRVEEEAWDSGVVHELVHLILFPTSTLCETMCEHLDRNQTEILGPLLTSDEEPAVNRLTEAIVGD